MPLSQRRRRLLEGFLLGLGAPIGWVAFSTALSLWDKATAEYLLYLFLYMTLGSSVVFALFSHRIGSSEERFEQQSIRDHLTGLYNTRFFHERFHQEYSHALRRRTPVTLVLLDLDHFKLVNDTHGHQAGDLVLQATARRMQKLIRVSDVLARVGGEEFVVIMPEADSEGGRELAERIRRSIRGAPVRLPGGAMLSVKASLGVAGTDLVHVEGPAQLFAAVDAALYAAKNGGRDRVVVQSRFWSPEKGAALQRDAAPDDDPLRNGPPLEPSA